MDRCDGSVMENCVVTIRKRVRGTKCEEIVMRSLNNCTNEALDPIELSVPSLETLGFTI